MWATGSSTNTILKTRMPQWHPNLILLSALLIDWIKSTPFDYTINVIKSWMFCSGYWIPCGNYIDSCVQTVRCNITHQCTPLRWSGHHCSHPCPPLFLEHTHRTTVGTPLMGITEYVYIYTKIVFWACFQWRLWYPVPKMSTEMVKL